MKKVLSLLLLSSIILPSFAGNYIEPQWTEFCPGKYATIDTETNYVLPDKKYWQQRRIVFNARVRECKHSETSDEIKACYGDIRKIEKDATKIYLEGRTAEQSKVRMYMKL